MGLFFGTLCIIVLVIRFSIEVRSFMCFLPVHMIQTFAIDDEAWDRAYVTDYVSFIIVGITVLVVAIPEGLPLAVTIALAYSVKKMLQDNNLVRCVGVCHASCRLTVLQCACRVRDDGQRHHHLLGQDRHADQEPHDGGAGVHEQDGLQAAQGGQGAGCIDCGRDRHECSHQQSVQVAVHD